MLENTPKEDPTLIEYQTPETLAVIEALGGTTTPTDFLRAHVEKTGGEHRPQQEEMLEAVAEAISTKAPLIVQAGTGTGKSLAYLFPVAVLQGRGVVATATNQLSEQLLRHDLPQVKNTLQEAGHDLSFALLKGRNNYACFSGDEQLITKSGIKTFRELNGKTELVCDGDKNWVEAEIKSFGRQEITELTVKRRNVTKIIHTTQNHRWFIEKNSGYLNKIQEKLTKELSPGDSLKYLYPKSVLRNGRRWKVVKVQQTTRREEVFCAVVPTTQSFVLAGGILTGNCLEKIDELNKMEEGAQSHGGVEQDTLFDSEQSESQVQALKSQAKKDAHLLAEALEWAAVTDTGDRTEGPTMPERVWSRISTSSADCPGAADCPFGDRCFTEFAREKARKADIVVTNHALLARDMNATSAGGGSTLFGDHRTVVIDEAHDFLSTLTDALSKELNPRALNKFLSRTAKYIRSEDSSDDDPGIVAEARTILSNLQDALENIPQGPIIELNEITIELLEKLTNAILEIRSALLEAVKRAVKANQMKKSIAITLLSDQAEKNAELVSSLRAIGPEQVRWVEKDRKDNTPIMFVSPIAVGNYLREAIAGRTLIATSATLTVGKDFKPFAHGMGLDLENYKAKTLDVGSPFNYPAQGMLYIPKAPFPAPIGKDRVEHTAAVLDTLEKLVHAAGGRTLALFTTTSGALNAAEHLKKKFPTLTVHAHGEDSADALVRKFAEEETSVLCVTMGLWQGISVEGISCSLVVIDKIAFAPVDDVLTAARRAYADKEGRNGFNEIIVGQAATSLAQGAGRLIRSAADKGVVAVLDPRLLTKGYGRILINSMPNFGIYSDLDDVTAALTRLTGGLENKGVHYAPQGKHKNYYKPSKDGKNKTSSVNNKHKPVQRAKKTKRIGL